MKDIQKTVAARQLSPDETPTMNGVVMAVSNPYINAATANNTRKAYRADIQHFERWGGCLPTTSDVIVEYLKAYATTLNPNTLSRRVVALKSWHIYQGFSDPTQDPLVRKTLKGITNTHGKPVKKAAPLSPEDLQRIVAYLESDDSITAWRDSALLQLGYFGAFRRSELISIEFTHISRSKQGIEILVPKSKTDQAGKGLHCAIPYGHKKLCPIRTLDVWLDKAKITSGPIFRRIDRWGVIGLSALTPLALTQIIKKRAAQCGLPDANDYSSHSLRRGLATTASRKGASLKAIMQQGRWRHVSTVLGYIEEGQRFNDNAAGIILRDEEETV